MNSTLTDRVNALSSEGSSTPRQVARSAKPVYLKPSNAAGATYVSSWPTTA